ncbi:helix-turn-helix protein [Trichococcus patagoniensis]|uniref:Helix-turn-helix protein n=1 Tax=Trichococcus patagoniensis TaxID=382641 RepID=A0A2T5IJI0_9LACT|nr:helix-turn-helix domain-containing protein [Trichococcus patagoniensis]PTQ83951.1 helix-turn-helix protein [Trichococcus patagoniensis]
MMEKVIDIFAMGYGTVPRMVMTDRELTIEAKAIYAYFAACIGAGDTYFPTVEDICKDLKMGMERFQKHKKLLIKKGYLTIKKDPTANGRFGTNVYVIQQLA